MTRRLREVQLTDGRVKYIVTIEDEPSGIEQKRRALHAVLQQLAESPSLLVCGTVACEVLSLRHDGERWIVTAEATAKKEQAWSSSE